MELPEDLMTLILSKLPVKSLLRFKCVQKSWYSLVNSPHFIHLQRSSIKKKNDSIIIRRFIKQQEGHVLSLHSYETLDDLGSQINLPALSNNRAWICGSCEGLVCLTNYNADQILICNPSIRESRSLVFPPSLSVRSGIQIDSVALGSDPNTGQYAVVMIGVPFYHDRIHGAIYGDREARLYNFSTDSWRETAMAFPPGPFLYSRLAVSLNGAFHWCPWRDSKNIITFHISNEVTGFIPLPDFFDDIGVFSDKHLCVSTKSQLLSLVLFDYWGGRFEISVMTEYGVNESWTRLFNIGPLQLNIQEPTVFWDEQRLLLRSEQGQLVSCDFQHHPNLRHFPIDGDFNLYPYSQSLVSVNGIGKSIV